MTRPARSEVTPVKAKWATIILAAGKGTRMHSPLAKVLHEIQGRTILSYPLELARNIGSERIIVVVGHQAEHIRKSVVQEGVTFVHQEQQLGTGHAIMKTKEVLKDFEGSVLILCGDVPLLRLSTIQAMTDIHARQGASVTVLTALLNNPSGYGRIVKDSRNDVMKVVEERDATDDEKKITEINTGIYCAKSAFLFEVVEQIGNRNSQKEYYFTDIFEIARGMKAKVISVMVNDPREAMGINTPNDLELARKIMTKRSGNNRAI